MARPVPVISRFHRMPDREFLPLEVLSPERLRDLRIQFLGNAVDNHAVLRGELHGLFEVLITPLRCRGTPCAPGMGP